MMMQHIKFMMTTLEVALILQQELMNKQQVVYSYIYKQYRKYSRQLRYIWQQIFVHMGRWTNTVCKCWSQSHGDSGRTITHRYSLSNSDKQMVARDYTGNLQLQTDIQIVHLLQQILQYT